MFDLICIFTTGGVVLWSKAFFSEMKFDLLNLLIKNVLLQEKASLRQFNEQNCILKWQLANDVGIVFAVFYSNLFAVI